MAKKIKKTTEQFKLDVLAAVGSEYTVLDEYINNKTKIMIRHEKCGREYSVRPDTLISSKSKCKLCSLRKSDEQFKTEVLDLVGDEYIFHDKYETNEKKLNVTHMTCGHKYSVSPVRFIMGQRCPVCSRALSKKSQPKYEADVKALVGDEYLVIGNYINNKEKILMKHNFCGKTFETLPTNFLFLGNRCPDCFGNNKKTTEQFSIEVSKLENGTDYLVSGEYINDKTKIAMTHKTCGHTYNVRPGDFIRGRRCPNCSLAGTSFQEKEIADYIKFIYPGDVIQGYRDATGLEIDIYIPDKKIGIEYNGLYWHSDLYKKKDYHLKKTKHFSDLGIRIIHIFEDEWIQKRKIVESKLSHIIGMNFNEKIYARKCSIKEIDPALKDNFLNKNHIQGSDRSSIKLGMFFNEELISVMTFGTERVSLGNKGKSSYELIRFASAIDKLVIGGFSKILTYFKKNYEWNTVKTYADLRWSWEDSVYKKSGFELIHSSKPNYWYFSNDKIRKHRYAFNKQKIKEKFPDIYNKNLTEFQIMDQTDFLRIYDCGNLVYEMKKE
jgi:Zn ribbon nucleic-acid-binding protein